MIKYKFYNNIVGWFTFLIALITYFLTLEPTVSFWDCGEFIAASYKMQVGHPPGAPFYMILGRLASLLAADKEQVALMVNGLSALASAFTILFLFWTITHLAKKLFINNKNEISISQTMAILGAGFVGGLAYTFSDTFWFSAVEAEVYAMSSLFTAIVFWAILKWEDASENAYADKWLLLIAYLIGLSTGVHLLNLLVIPAVGYIFYYKKYNVTRKGLIKTFVISSLILVGIMYGIIQGLIIIAAKVELLFVNSFGLPFNSGAIFFIFLLIIGLIWGLYYTHKKNILRWNTIILCLSMIIIGYSTFTIIPIRSAANPPTDTNNPDNVFSLRKYVNREQYGDRPLIYGHSFNSKTTGTTINKPIYTKEKGKYVSKFSTVQYKYVSSDKSFFPRMYSTEGSHKREYAYWAGIDINRKRIPSFMENMRFFFKYHCGQMYFRYFMWNFAGKQNNIYAAGQDNFLKGNWISGIKFIDENRLGNQSTLSTKMKKQSSRNKYYFLPFILGLIGMYFQLSLKNKGKRSFWIVFLLFFFTGLAIVIYLNQTPIQPRERDYAYAGSFYAFAIWIGFGVLGVYSFLKRKLNPKTSAITATIASFLLVPLIMACENWDDHDRSGRYFARNTAYNFMMSCKKNSILFTYGDNDTFPLWYLQDVEYVRPDVRLCNLSYLNSGWYTEQMDRKAYESAPMPFALTKKEYQEGSRKVVYLIDHPTYKKFVKKEGGLNLQQAILFLKSDNPRTKQVTLAGGQRRILDYLPAKKFYIPVDKEKVIKNGYVSSANKDKIVDKLIVNYDGKRYLLKNNIMALDAISGSKWERPIYFSSTIGASNMQGLREYTQLEGIAYSLVPIKTRGNRGRIGRVDVEKMYHNFMNVFKWRGLDNPKVLLEITNGDGVVLYNIRAHFLRLIETLVVEKKLDKAETVLDKYFSIFHPDRVLNMNTHDRLGLNILRFYFLINKHDKGDELAKSFANHLLEEIEYYFSLDQNSKFYVSSKNERETALSSALYLSKQILEKNNRKKLSDEVYTDLKALLKAYSQRYKI